uniref:sn-1-specific diacylglycerol lipase ABHD11 n=1 Tax=Parastrongyloides trichosuri TaxID=131310 RepID=A0A0N4ZNY6_PARTI
MLVRLFSIFTLRKIQLRGVGTLSYVKYGNSTNISLPPLVITHGLFGNKKNWHSVSMALQKALDNQIYAVDLRNHGDSPHYESMTYPDMANDLDAFITNIVKNETGYDKIDLLGHSMGGKTSMQLVFNKKSSENVRKLIIEDISPTYVNKTHLFPKYIKALMNIDYTLSRIEIDNSLKKEIHDDATRAFLLTNLYKEPGSDNFKFKANLKAIEKYIDHIIGYTFDNKNCVFTNDTLFMSGEHSLYVSPNDRNTIRRFFPNVTFDVIENAGHWIHADNFYGFKKSVVSFLKK